MQSEMKLQWKSLLCWLDPNLDIGYLSTLCWKEESYLAGHLVGRPTASWFDSKTKRSASGGLEKIFMTILLTLCGQTKLQCNSKHTGDSAAGKRARDQKPCNKPRPKHPIKLHVWGAISYCGATKLCIFNSIVNAKLYIQILEECLVPFLNQVYPSGHRFMQDNDLKHTSRRAQAFFSEQKH